MVEKKVRYEKGELLSLQEVVEELLPKDQTAFVEVQRDQPGQAHPSHTHPNDEILHILSGCLHFQADGTMVDCSEGDRIYLPKGTLHGSVAGAEGCTYVISIRKEDEPT
ncbi:cupin domain-containing protein [Aureibacillus halotolerans]|uniref:Cupin domain n=1 Tax=Aureibacillus halotolerans TaxID=1508390 RepID=A0A4R6TUF1_9BACI|nr:cupin domain-containing protein [Aureibacillus halotolerans]TDQ34126.1 cupin domain [Aureibacillus halotolerans]